MKAFKIMILIALAVIVCGFGYKVYSERNIEYKTVCFHERVKPRECFNTILEQYYNPENEKESWNEWQYRMAERNHFLFYYKDGSPRMLQPGDIVCIECRIRIKK